MHTTVFLPKHSGALAAPPRRIFLLSWLIVGAWQVPFVYGTGIFGILSFAEMHRIFHSLLGLAVFLLTFGLAYGLYRYYIALMVNYNKSDAAYSKALKGIKQYETLLIITPVILSFLIPSVMMRIQAPHYNGTHTFHAVMMFSVGNCFLYALLFYIFFIQKFEIWLHPIPLHTAYRGMPIKKRSVLTAFFGFTGTVVLALAPLVILEAGDSVQYTLLTKTFPLAVIGTFLGLCDSYLQSGGTAFRLQKIVDFTAYMAKGDYTAEKMNIISRDELGFLMNELNEFQNITSNLLRQISEELNQLRSVGSTLVSNMKETAGSVYKINTNIDGVKQQTLTQAASVQLKESAKPSSS